MIFRLANESDLSAIYNLGFASYSSKVVKDYKITLNHERAKIIANNLIKQGCVFVAEDKIRIVGAMIGTITPSIFSDDLIYGSLFFFMVKGYRNLANNFISQISGMLKQKKITRIIIGNPEFNHPEKMDRFYKLLGFRRLETHYIRSL